MDTRIPVTICLFPLLCFPAFAEDGKPATGMSSVLLLSDKSLKSLLAEGYEPKASIMNLLVLQKPGQFLPVYFCEVGDVEGRRTGLAYDKDDEKQTHGQSTRIIVRACFVQAE